MTNPTEGNSSERFYGLDLLRVAAILMVVTWHLPRSIFPFQWKPATWAGVDLFFVLSGYLIGSQLLRPYTLNSQPSFLNFYLRRTMRVLPAYFVVVALYFIVPQFREQPNLSPLWKFLTFTQNFGLDFAATGAFTHAWSLCVEEHFYLVLPLIVYWLMKKPNFTTTWLFAALVVAFGLITRSWLWMHYVKPLGNLGDHQVAVAYLEKIYYPTYARLDGLLVGVLLAAGKLFRPVWWKRITCHGNKLLGAGILTLVFSLWICQDMFSFATAVVGFPLLALGFGLLVMSSLSDGSILAKFRLLGASTGATLAYSTYLTHKQIMHLDREYLSGFVPMDGVLGLAVYAVSILAGACILHLCVERPFLKLRDRVSDRKNQKHQTLAAAAIQSFTGSR